MSMYSMLRHALVPALALLPLLAPTGALAQTPPPGTPPAEVQQQIDALGLRATVLNRIQTSGMTPDQIRRRLASMGYDPRTLDPYLSNEDDAPPPPSQRALEAARALRFLDDMPAPAFVPPDTAALTAEERRLNLRVFGVDVFARGSSEFDPMSMGAVPSTYVIGPGDELVLVITGDVEMVHTLPVTREGFVLIPQVGQVWVNGQTLQSLREQLYTRLGQVYSGVRRGGGGSTQFDISLARTRLNQIYISGEVVRPGAYTVSPMASVLNALYQAGGPSASGSFREIQVRRGGQAVQRVDLYEYLLGGDNLDRVRLEPGDIIFVPVHGERVSIRGEVTREAIYELRRGETLLDLLQFAGGPTAPAHLRAARLTRVLPPSQRTTPGVDRVVMDIDLTEAIRNPRAAPPLEAGDDLRVMAVRSEVRNMVSLNGSVWRPGSYSFQPGMRAWDLIATAEGLSPEAFVDRAHITRLNPADSTLTMIPFSLRRGEDGSLVENPVLHENDVVTIYSRAQRVENLHIEISGAVREPGRERYQAGMTLRDAIIQAGGLRRVADPVVEVARLADPAARAAGHMARIIRIPVDSSYFVSEEAARYYLGDPEAMRRAIGDGPAADFVLQPFDRILVREIAAFEVPRTIIISGEVVYPGTYTLQQRSERLRNLILDRAAGLTPNAYPRGMRFYRDGTLVNVDLPAVLARADHRDNLALMPGDSVYVPEYNPVITVAGAVNSPTSVLYRPGAGLEYYIENAGGFARNADAKRVHVRYANGEGRTTGTRGRLFRSHPTPEPGSVVTVPFILESDRTDTRGLITDIVQIVGSLATVILVVSRIN
jgi:polysaccharide biosynthesis/export protein